MSNPAEHKPLEFWLSFGSPYSYFASLQIDELAASQGRTVLWRPFVIGAAFKQTGMVATVNQPMRGPYARRDWDRLARLLHAPYAFPSRFPIESIVPGRMFYAVESENPAKAIELAKRFYRGYYGEGLDISNAETAAGLGEELSLDRKRLLAAAEEPAWKDALRARTDEALAKGVFGAPYFIVDGEPFWGWDRLPMVRQWLETGGW